jgi:hypothetical protein
MIYQILDGIINKMNSLIGDIVKGHPNLVNMHSYINFVVIVVVLVVNALASTPLVT